MRVLAAGPESLERLGLFESNLETSSSHNHRHRANQTEQIICVRPTTRLRAQTWRKYSDRIIVTEHFRSRYVMCPGLARRAPTRRSVVEESLPFGPLEARRPGSSVAGGCTPGVVGPLRGGRGHDQG